jgi:hypothetical protein
MREHLEEERSSGGSVPTPVVSPTYLSIQDCARLFGIGVSTTRRLLRHEPDVIRIILPGRRRAIVRVPQVVVERILRRSRVL